MAQCIFVRNLTANNWNCSNVRSPFEGGLEHENRWIRLAQTLNWREMEVSYAKLFSAEGRPAIRARYVLGVLILKHQFQTSDQETLQLILENSYCQYFLGFAKFTKTMSFDVSSLSRVRDRL